MFRQLKARLTNYPESVVVVGLQTATKKDIEDIKLWFKVNNIPFEHKTHFKQRVGKLPANGVLKINPKHFPKNPFSKE